MPGASELRDDNALIRVHWHGPKDFSKRRCLNSTRRTRLVPQGSLALEQRSLKWLRLGSGVRCSLVAVSSRYRRVRRASVRPTIPSSYLNSSVETSPYLSLRMASAVLSKDAIVVWRFVLN